MLTTATKPSIKAVLETHGATVRERSGWQPIRCPYHDDTTASASVNTREGAFLCHACGVKGDAYSLIQAHENCDFKRAVEIGNGYTADGNTPTPQRTKRSPMKGIWEL